MKKLFLLLSLVPVLLMCSLAAWGANEGSVVITHAQGNPMIVRGLESIPATIGSVCHPGDTIQTTGECTVDLSMNQMAGCRLLSSSECAIVGSSKEAMRLNITSGNAVLNLEKLPKDSTFEVETPTAIASVRGTQFWGRVDPARPNNPVTTFAVRKGVIDVFAKSAGKNFRLAEGQALDIPKEGAEAPQIRSALDPEMKAMEQADVIKTKIE